MSNVRRPEDEARPAADSGAIDRWIRAGALPVALAIALVPRLLTRRTLFGRGETMQWDGDSAYHLKRILHAVDHVPDLPRFDPAMNWPAGAPCPWPDGFDLLAAAWGLVAGGGDPERAKVAVLLFTPVLALLVVWAAMDLARLVLPAGPAREAAVASVGLMVGLMPTAIYQSQAGFLDHHVAELLAFLVLAGWALRRLPRPDEHGPAPGARWEAGGAVAATFALWVFAGGALYVAIAVAVVAVAALRDARPTLVGSGMPALAAAACASALLTIPALRSHGRLLTYQFPSLLQPLLLVAGAATVGLAVGVARGVRGAWRRGLVVAALLAVLAALAALTLPAVREQVVAGLSGWLLRKDPWIAAVAEFQPFGWADEHFVQALFKTYGTLGVLAPVLLVAGGVVAVRAAGARGIAFTAIAAAFVLFTLNQVRFERIGQPLLMIGTAALLAAWAHRRGAGVAGIAVRAFPLVATTALILADPFLRQGLTQSYARIHPAASAAVALRDLAGSGPRDGVLTTWDQGHVVSVLSGLPTPTNGFGSFLDPQTFAEAEASFLSDGPTLDAFLSARRLRFVVAGGASSNLSAVKGLTPFAMGEGGVGGVLNPDYMKAFGLSSLVIGGSAVPGLGVPHAERLMPVFATRERVVGLAFPLPALWIYERVPGARLVGTTTPSTGVEASLDFKEQGFPHVWRAHTVSDRDGRWELTVPFPTGLLRPGLSSEGRMSVRAGEGAPRAVAAPEASVREGATVAVGALPAGSRRHDRPAMGSRRTSSAPPPAPFAAEMEPPRDSAMP